MKKKLTKGGMLASAILWTIVTLMWTVIAVLRFFNPLENAELQWLSVITVLMSLIACVIFWVRYAQYETI